MLGMTCKKGPAFLELLIWEGEGGEMSDRGDAKRWAGSSEEKQGDSLTWVRCLRETKEAEKNVWEGTGQGRCRHEELDPEHKKPGGACETS